MTTVGYGDKIPKLNSGRLIAGISSVLAIILLSMPMVILGINLTMKVNYMKELKDKKIEKRLAINLFNLTDSELSGL